MTKPGVGSWTEEGALLNFSSEAPPPPLLDTAEKLLETNLCLMSHPPFLICFLRLERAACRALLSFVQLQQSLAILQQETDSYHILSILLHILQLSMFLNLLSVF